MQERRSYSRSFKPEDLKEIKTKVLAWLSGAGTFLYLDSHEYPDPYGRYELLAGCESVATFQNLEELKQAPAGAWYFGHLNYDYKNKLFPGLNSRHPAQDENFQELSFFEPQTICAIFRNQPALVIESYLDPEAIARQIMEIPVPPPDSLPAVKFQRRQKEAGYYDALNKVLEHLAAGDCYELNYCSEAVAHVQQLQPFQVYQALKEKSPTPFSTFYRQQETYLMGASPERYFCKKKSQLIAQPIKGTAARGADAAADERAKTALRESPKEQAENVMIVDLLRNDLARCCEPGSVQVTELFGIYTFPTVHQLISTVTGTISEGVTVPEILEKTFPMGSMTGAPKKRVMELTDLLEESRRGIYAGTVGYLSPDGDADFNVVIRSLSYNAASGRLSYHTGGAITHQSIPEQEWEEMLLKGRALEQLFAG